MTSTAFTTAPGECHAGEPLPILGDTALFKVSSADSGGQLAIWEEITPPLGGPPLHVHRREDEWFQVLEGKFLFEIDGNRIELAKGGSAFVPIGVPHTFENIGDAPGRLLIVVRPGGMDLFFRELAAACPDGVPDMKILVPVFEKFGLEILGPPLAARVR